MSLSIEYKKGSVLSELNDKDFYIQANNALGNWGAGVAVDFKKHFPKTYEAHRAVNNKVGMGYYLTDDGYNVGCLITSHKFGRYKDGREDIIINTYTALINFYRQLVKNDRQYATIHAPKFNSGYFDVPWEYTEKIIREVDNLFVDSSVHWVIWEY